MPLTLMEPPPPRVLTALPEVPGETPGTNNASSRKFRPFSGTSLTFCWSIVVPTEEFGIHRGRISLYQNVYIHMT